MILVSRSVVAVRPEGLEAALDRLQQRLGALDRPHPGVFRDTGQRQAQVARVAVELLDDRLPRSAREN
jgi:hypothetical protein